VRGIARRLRSNFGIRSSRMTIRSQMAWYWRWLLNVLMMVAVAGGVWWLVENSYRITGFNREEAKQQIASLGEENATLRRELDAARASLTERERQAAIDKASQSELARNVTQLQDENATLKEELGFLRNIMSSGATPEGLGIANLKVEPEGQANEFRYRMLLTQGGQRKQDFKGRVQVIARVAHQGGIASFTFPDASAPEGAGAVEFRFYQKVDGRFRIPEGAVLKSLEVRVLAIPGGQVKLSRTLNIS
jgi:regulator of replication initiation timing